MPRLELIVSVLVLRRVAPFPLRTILPGVGPAGTAPRLESEEIITEPPLMVTAPPNEFGEARVTAPPSCFVMPNPEPEMAVPRMSEALVTTEIVGVVTNVMGRFVIVS